MLELSIVFFLRLTVIPGPPLFSLTVRLLDPFACHVEFINVSNEFLHTGRDCIEGNPPGTINAAFVLLATQLDQVRVHSDEFATGTAHRVVVYLDFSNIAAASCR